MTKDAITAAVRKREAKVGTTITGQAYLGDGSGTVVKDQANRLANYWIPVDGGNARVVSSAVLWTRSGIPFKNIDASLLITVDLGFPPNDSRLNILGENGSTGVAGQGGYTLAEQEASEISFPKSANVQEWRVSPVASDVTEVRIAGGAYVQPSTGAVLRWGEGDTGSVVVTSTLTALIAALSAGQHQIAWICFDDEAGNPEVVTGTAATALGTLPSRDEFLDADFNIATTYRNLIPVYLYYGQTGIADTADPATSDIIRGWDTRSIARSTDDIRAKVLTTNATVTTLYTFTIPASATYAISAKVVARRTGGASGTAEDGAYYERVAAIKNVAGTATIIGSVASIVTIEDQAGWDCTIDVTGATARVRVTGAVSNSISWVGAFKICQVSS